MLGIQGWENEDEGLRGLERGNKFSRRIMQTASWDCQGFERALSSFMCSIRGGLRLEARHPYRTRKETSPKMWEDSGHQRAGAARIVS